MFEQYMPDEIQGAVAAFSQASNTALQMYMQYRNAKTFGKENNLPQKNALLDMLREYNAKNPIVFNGSLGDMKYFWSRNTLPLDEILKIENDELRQSIIDGLNRRTKEGLLDFNNDTKCYCLTEQGKHTIFNQDFIGMVFKLDAEQYQQYADNITAQAELEGVSVDTTAESIGNYKPPAYDDFNKQKEFAEDKEIGLKKTDVNSSSNKPIPVDTTAETLHTAQNSTKTAAETTAKTAGKATTETAAKTTATATAGAATMGASVAVELAYKACEVAFQPIKNQMR